MSAILGQSDSVQSSMGENERKVDARAVKDVLGSGVPSHPVYKVSH